LESLFSAGKLVKIHGGDATGWGPSPKWLLADLRRLSARATARKSLHF
jgi:hypothetical protein